ncbi:MAG: glycine hydroxymethyltransferase [Verrucomicrobiota bacterium]|nr:glycine hydroxymethyltransferase [Verrucomicrobiota bacterium]
MNSPVQSYLKQVTPENINTEFLAYLANLSSVAKVAPNIVKSIIKELEDQRTYLKLIASENYCSLPTQLAMGNLLTDKYSEGFPHHRFYAGCDNVDDIEAFACEEACKLFGAENAYVQPHSGADANLIAFWAILNTRVEIPALEKFGEMNPSKLNKDDWNKLREELGNQRMLGMDYYSGGHLTHGYRHNVSAQMFDAYNYGVDKKTGRIDYDKLQEQVNEIKPLIFLVGYSAYPRHIDFSRMREIADSVNAVLLVDMAHFAGLVAGKAFTGVNNPVPYADVVTTTTHKTLRGPRGALILCKDEFAGAVNKGCPLVIGGPLPHVMAAKAVAFVEANKPSFQEYAKNVLKNADAMAKAFIDEDMTLATGGTDNHLMLVDVRPFGLTGRQAESVLRDASITLNRNSLPKDPNGPWYTSGLRFGSPATTTLGMRQKEMKEIVSIIKSVLENTTASTIAKGPNKGKKSKAKYNIDNSVLTEARSRVKELLDKFPVYPELDLDFMKKEFD